MKKFLSILLVLVMAVGLMTTVALADDKVAGVQSEEAYKAVITAKDIGNFQSCFATVDIKGDLVLSDVQMTIDGQALDVTDPEKEIPDGTKAMFAWNPETGLIAYATGAEGGKSISAEEAVFTLTFAVAKDKAEPTEEVPVDVTIVFYNAESAEVKPVEVKAVGTGNIKVNAAAVMIGDVTGDGKINGQDLLRLKKYLAKVEGTVINEANTEMINGKAGVNGQDLLRLAKYLAKVEGTVLG